jgi:hypothetical protein
VITLQSTLLLGYVNYVVDIPIITLLQFKFLLLILSSSM